MVIRLIVQKLLTNDYQFNRYRPYRIHTNDILSFRNIIFFFFVEFFATSNINIYLRVWILYFFSFLFILDAIKVKVNIIGQEESKIIKRERRTRKRRIKK